MTTDEERIAMRAERRKPARNYNVQTPNLLPVIFTTSSQMIVFPAGTLQKVLAYVDLVPGISEKEEKLTYPISITLRQDADIRKLTVYAKRGTNTFELRETFDKPPVISFTSDDARVASVSANIVYTLSQAEMCVEVADA